MIAATPNPFPPSSTMSGPMTGPMSGPMTGPMTGPMSGPMSLFTGVPLDRNARFDGTVPAVLRPATPRKRVHADHVGPVTKATRTAGPVDQEPVSVPFRALMGSLFGSTGSTGSTGPSDLKQFETQHPWATDFTWDPAPASPSAEFYTTIHEMDAQLALEYEALTRTWGFGECPLPDAMATIPHVSMPSLFAFVDVVTKLLHGAKRLSVHFDANQLLWHYRAEKTNPTPIVFFNLHAERHNVALVISQGRVGLDVRLGGQVDATFTLENTLNTSTFQLGETYCLTKSFCAEYLGGERRVVHVGVARPAVRKTPSVAEAVQTGTAFDLYFPKIAQPVRLATQFSGRTGEVAAVDDSPSRVFAGHLAFLVGIGRECRPRSKCWPDVTPQSMLVAGNFTHPAFPGDYPKFTKAHVSAMCRTFTDCADFRLPSGPADSKNVVSGWLLKRAWTSAQETRRYYDTARAQRHLVDMKSLCVAWKVLQVTMGKSPELFALMLRTFCHSVNAGRNWTCFHRRVSVERLVATDPHPGQKWSYSTEWALGTSSTGDIWAQDMHHAFRVQTGTTLALGASGTRAWMHACSFTVLQEGSHSPRIQIGKSFKIK